jgi:cell division septation protein DedD
VPQERRLARRKTLERLTYIDLPSHNGGIVIDVSEGGLSFHAIAPVENGGPIHFSLCGGSQRIAGTGELMWTDWRGQVGGLRFTEIPEEIREQIRNWPLESNLRFNGGKDSPRTVPAADPPLPAALAAPAVPVLPKSAAQPSKNQGLSSYAPYFPEAVSKETQRGKRVKRSSRLLKTIGIASLAGVIGVAAYLCYNEARRWMAAPGATAQSVRQAAENAAPAGAAQGTLQARDARPPGPQAAAKPQAPPASSEMIFVQVAAYTNQADALNLVDSLRAQDFIAFVRPPTTDAYYRVQLGPYTNLEAAQIGKRELEKAGFTPFIRH